MTDRQKSNGSNEWWLTTRHQVAKMPVVDIEAIKARREDWIEQNGTWGDVEIIVEDVQTLVNEVERLGGVFGRAVIDAQAEIDRLLAEVERLETLLRHLDHSTKDHDPIPCETCTEISVITDDE